MGYGYEYEKHDDECKKEEKKCYDYSYKKYYVKKCYCKCCYEPYYPYGEGYQSDSGYDHKKDYDSGYDHQKDYGYKSDNSCSCKKRYY